MNEQYTRAPHRRSQPQSSPSPNAALLIDFDNVTMAMRSNLGQELRNFLNSDIVRGKVSVQRAYADWRRYPQYIVPLSEASIDLIFAPAYGSSKKNATDIRLAIDALEIVFTRPEIGTYILLSGDSDFSSLVLKLKEYGKYVIGVGLQESTSDLLVQNCDEYYSYNSLSGLTSAEEISTRKHDPWELVEKAAHRMKERSDVMRSDRLKQVMLELDGTFDEKDLGFNKFNRFLAEASSRGLLQLRKIGDGHYEISPVGRKPSEREEPSAPEPAAAEPVGRDAGAPARADRAPSGKRSRRGGRGRSGEARREPAEEGRPSGAGRAREEAREEEVRPRQRTAGTEPPPEIEAASLRRAYDLLREVVRELSDGRGSVRDSEVKREMLRRKEDFDEAALGFSKFSRFLRQAYDEEVVELTTDPDGNYHLQPEGARPVTFEEAEDGGDAGEAAAEPSGDVAPEPEGRTAAPAVSEETEEEAPSEAAVREPEPRPEESEEAGRGEEPEPAPEQPARRRRGGLGRFRRGSRDAPAAGAETEAKDAIPGASVGPVDEPDEGESDDADAESEDRPAAASAGGRGRRSRGGVGRFRRGSRREADEEEAEESGEPEGPSIGPVDEGGEDDSAPGTVGPSASGEPPAGTHEDVTHAGSATGENREPVPPAAVDDPVGYMIGNYPGVGRKTAEKLVEAFGDEVFDVIDRDPERLAKILPEHRAHAVIEAREAHRRRAQA